MSEKNTVLISDFGNDEETDFEEAEILSETKAEIITEPDEKVKELIGINALLANLPADSDVSIIVTRLNDRQFRNQFRLPCSVDSKVETVAWDGEAYPDSIYEYIQKKYGGGHYRFQLRYNGGFKEAWKDVLSDPAEPSEKEKLINDQKKPAEPVKVETPQMTFQTPQTETKPVTQQDFMRDLIEQKKLEKELAELLAPTPQTHEAEQKAEPRSTNKLDFLMDIYRETNEEGLRNKIVNATLGVSDPKSEVVKRTWLETIADTFAASPTLQNKATQIMENIVSLATSALTPKTNIPMQNQPPGEAPPITLDSFRVTPNGSPTVSPAENAPEATETENQTLVIDSPFQFIPIGEKQND